MLRKLAHRYQPFLVVTAILAAISAGLTMYWDLALALQPSFITYVAIFTILGLVIVSLILSLAGFDPVAEDLAREVSSGEPSEIVIHRWLSRVRWRRWLFGTCGILAGVFASINETSGHMIWLAFPGFVALTVASWSAELHHFRRSRTSARTVDLTPRRWREYSPRFDRWVLPMTAATSAALVAVAATSEHLPDGSLVWFLIASIVLAAGFALQILVVRRPRSAIPDELRRADDLIRRVALSHGINRPAITLALASIAMGLEQTDSSNAPNDFTLAGKGGLVWMLAIGFWWFNRKLDADRLLWFQDNWRHGAAT